jgi:hypothetical protein
MYLCLVDTKLSTNLIIEEIPYVDGDAAPVAAEEGEATAEGDTAPVAAKKAEEEKVEEEEGEGYKKTTVLDNATSSTDVADTDAEGESAVAVPSEETVSAATDADVTDTDADVADAVAAKEGDEEGYAKPIVQGDAAPDAEVVDTNPNTKATIAPSLLGYNRPSVPADDNDSRSYNKSKKGGAISSDNITKCFGALKNIFESTDMETISSFEVKTVDDIQKNYNSIAEDDYNAISIPENENKEGDKEGDIYDAYYFGIQHDQNTHVSEKVNISKIKDDKINLYETVIMTALWLLGNNKFANDNPENLIWYILNKNSIDAKKTADAEKAVAAEKKAVEKADEKAAVDAKKAAVDAKKARLKDLLKAMFIKNKAVVDVFQKYPTQTVESNNDKDTYDTAVIADNLVANALKAAENAASATENAVEAAENAASATENAVNNRNTYNSIASAYVIALRKIEVVNKAVGAANDAFNAAKDAVVATNAIITGVDDGVS